MINTLHSEHLNDGERPLIASICNREDCWKCDNESTCLINNEIGLFIDYYGEVPELDKNQIKNGGEKTYVISPLDIDNKYSIGYRNCTYVIGIGKDKETGKNISFLSHQDPREFLIGKDRHENFKKDLLEILRIFQEKTIKGTIDIVIGGGNYFYDDKEFIFFYKKSISLLNNLIHDEIGLFPTVMTGPNIVGRGLDVYLDTQNRRVWLVRPQQTDNRTNQAYMPEDLELMEPIWVGDNLRGIPGKVVDEVCRKVANI